jgi:hypothetical protein
MKRINQAVVVDTCNTRLVALKAHVSPKAVIKVGGEAHKVGDIIKIYQQCLDTRAALKAKRAEVKAAQVVSDNAEVSRLAIESALKAWVVAEYGPDSNVAHEFGFPPRKVASRTAIEKADAVKLAQATREARHTMGSKQKQKVKGSVVEPIAAPAAPAASAPAPTVANGPPAAAPTSATNGVSNGALPHA